MLIQGIDLPEKLLEAQAAGDLVVFAGAGVSHPSPSSLPLFDELAERIGAGTGLARDDQEPADRYLGRLRTKGVDVHSAAAEILVNAQTAPHDLHRLLFRLFPPNAPIRLVTTNFDTHFSTILSDSFETKVETFFAPALPLGADFAGLVYLHGSAAKEPTRCVLTDEDFGRAYLTEAWATRFLAAMFGRYAVLFIGYSHGDPVMNYLARGLPPRAQKPRYAFTTADRQSLERWSFLGVSALVYELSEADNRHEMITRCVRAWTLELRRGLLEKAVRIRAVVQGQPPLEGEDADYIRFSLRKIEMARVFFQYANSPEWISWLEKHGFFHSFFDRKENYGDFEEILGHWLVDRFFIRHAQDLLAIIQRHGGIIRRRFCWLMWHRLSRRRHDEEVNAVFSLWTAVLLMQPSDVLNPDQWGILLAVCSPDDRVAASLIFARVTRPALILKEHWSFGRDKEEDLQKVDFDLNLLDSSDHYLAEAWKKVIEPNIPDLAPLLRPAITANLAAADSLLKLCGRAQLDIDPFWIYRQSVAPHRENSFHKTLDYLIDAAREVVKCSVQDDPVEAMAQTHELFASGVPILQRLAIYSLAEASGLLPDQKLDWLIERHLLYRYKTDAFRVLKLNYPVASSSAKRRVIEAALVGPVGKLFDELDAQTRRYEIFNLLVWLKRAAPECELVEAQLMLVREQGPEYQEREQPDVDFSSGDPRWLEPGERFDVNGILATSIDSFLDERPAPVQANHFGHSRSRYCSKISAATARKPTWGLNLLAAITTRQLKEIDLWLAVCHGWRMVRCQRPIGAKFWSLPRALLPRENFSKGCPMSLNTVPRASSRACLPN